VAIVTGLAEATLGNRYGINWRGMREDYREIRRHIARVVPGCESYEVNVARPGGFVMPHPPRDSRRFPTKSGLAEFTVSTIQALEVPPGHLILQTVRSHDQFNTTIYGFSDRYRGVERGRHVVFVNPLDIEELGFQAGEVVDLVTHWTGDDHLRRAEAFRIVAYQTPRGTAAAYYPETNPLVPLDSTAVGSNTPTSKSVIIRLARPGTSQPTDAAGQQPVAADDHHESTPEPLHLS
jgi:anaerobic selenocysteine-containing dehydrogenase